MTIEIKIPEVGESVQEAILAEWYKSDGDYVEKDEPVFVLETDKVTLEVPAEAAGVLHIRVAAGETVSIGQVVGEIDAEAAKEEGQKAPEKEKEADKPAPEPEPEQTGEKPAEKKPETVSKEPAPAKPEEGQTKPDAEKKDRKTAPAEKPLLSPSVRRLVAEENLDVEKIKGTGPGGRVTKGDVILHLESGEGEKKSAQTGQPPSEPAAKAAPEEKTTRKAMSPIRKRIAAHLLAARQNTAMLTTFNDIDMSAVMGLRKRFKDDFDQRYGVRLGFMSFFIKASVSALREFPEVNAYLEENEIVYHHYYHIGVAIGAERGLVVPVIRHADALSFADLEKAVLEYAGKVKNNTLKLEDLEGGTFSITNGGVYGSLLSTPILNMPQSGILGMHRIEQRPVAFDGQVVIRPMMYVALSYDHRIVDGKDAVTFLRRIKELIENPERMMMEI